MSWARFDDRFHQNPKVLRAWQKNPASVGLHVMAITYCAQHETDGHVPAEWVSSLFRHGMQRKSVVNALLIAGLWKRNGSGFDVNDYLDYNPSRNDLKARRQAKIEAGRLGGKRSGEARSGRSKREATASSKTNPRPDPSPSQYELHERTPRAQA